MTKLMTLNSIPAAGREAEAVARRTFASRKAAYDAAEYKIVEAPGTYSRPFPSIIGWVLTQAAADAVVDGSICRMPGGTQHHLFSWERI